VARTVISIPQNAALPPALAETVGNFPRQARTYALVCKGGACLPPVFTLEDLAAAVSPHTP
jgi:uncharacterized protein YyaL (SSP411 family)